ncbi:MAG: hypothetical protein AB7G17_05875 [Phycisphaerales bacterium]
MTTTRFLPALAPLALVTALAGCGTMRVEGTMKLEGPLTLTQGSYISDATYDRLAIGDDSQWALAMFGKPDQKTMLADGSEVWRWTFQHMHTDPSLLSIGKGKDSDEPTEQPEVQNVRFINTYVHVRSGEVVDKWRG